VLTFFKSSGNRASPLVLLDIGDDTAQPTVKEEVLHLYNVIFLSDFVFLYIFCITKSLSWSKQIDWNQTPHFNIAFMGKSA
jgi:hypothetical protein